MGGAGSVMQAENADSEKLMEQLNHIACSEIMASTDGDLANLDSPAYCSRIIGLAGDALLQHIEVQSSGERKFLNILEGEVAPGKDHSSAKVRICEEFAYKYVLIYKIYQLIRSAVGHVGEVQDLCRKVTPKAKTFGGGYCQERLQALALAARDAQPGAQSATVSSKVCHLPSVTANRENDWAKRMDDLFEYMKHGSYDAKLHAAQVSQLDLRIGKQRLATDMADHERPAEFASIRPLDRSLGRLSKSACMERKKEGDGTSTLLPNAHYKFQIGEGVFLDKYREHEQKMRAVIRTAAGTLSGLLRKMFTGLNNPKGALTLAPGLTLDRLHAIAGNVRDVVVGMFIACDTQYVEAVNTFAEIVASEAYAETAGENRHAANAAADATQSKTRYSQDFGWDGYQYKQDLRKPRLKTYKSQFSGTPVREDKSKATSLSVQPPLVHARSHHRDRATQQLYKDREESQGAADAAALYGYSGTDAAAQYGYSGADAADDAEAYAYAGAEIPAADRAPRLSAAHAAGLYRYALLERPARGRHATDAPKQSAAPIVTEKTKQVEAGKTPFLPKAITEAY